MPDIEIKVEITQGYNLTTDIRVAGHCVDSAEHIKASLVALADIAIKRAYAAAAEGPA